MRRSALPLSFLAFLLCVAFSVVAGLLILNGSNDQRHHVTVLGRRVALTATQAQGHRVFALRCGACHQLSASRTIGAVGPNLDAVHPSYNEVLSAIQNGRQGSYGEMPADLVTGKSLYAVAAYVSHVANPHAYHP
jgi:mono/diheme cytochrome c family protein